MERYYYAEEIYESNATGVAQCLNQDVTAEITSTVTFVEKGYSILDRRDPEFRLRTESVATASAVVDALNRSHA